MGEHPQAGTLWAETELATEYGRNFRGPARVAFVVNNDWWFISHRATWGAALKSAGAEVTVIAEDTGKSETLRALGFQFVPVHIGREATNFFGIVKSAILVFFTLMRLRPDVVFLTAQAAYTVGWPAALFLRRTHFIRVVSGAGRALSPSALTTKASKVVRSSGRVAGQLRNVFTLFQVEHDRTTFAALGMLPDSRRSLVVPGTGIDAERWRRDGQRDFEKPIILFAARLFREKGIYEFVEAAVALSGRGWRFQIAGEPDPGVESTVTPEDIQRWRNHGAVELLGHCDDMVGVLSRATLFVLPTRHPEGTPKALIEAGAAGVPAIVSDQPGCKAVVRHGVTGVVLNTEPSAADVAAAIEALASTPDRCSQMGCAASTFVSATFSHEAVLSRLLEWEAVGAVRQ